MNQTTKPPLLGPGDESAATPDDPTYYMERYGVSRTEAEAYLAGRRLPAEGVPEHGPLPAAEGPHRGLLLVVYADVAVR